MKKLKGIIFDFDGTLADTLPMCILTFQQSLERITGTKFTESDIRKHFGISEEGIIASLAPQHYEAAVNEFIVTYRKNHQLCPHVFEGILDILDEIQAKGYKMALITGKGKHTIDIALEEMNLEQYFEYVEHGNTHKLVKAEGMEKILDLWELKPSEVAYVGDQPTDITESQKVGVTSIAVSWAKTSNHAELENYKPDFLFSHPSQFKEWLNTDLL